MKRGFTLIELLAVIVILAIIALIATPIVLNIINDTKESTVLRSAEFYLKGVEISLSNAQLNNKNIKEGTYSIMEDGNICLEEYDSNTKICKDNDENPNNNELIVEVKGENPKSGKVSVNAEGKVAMSLYNDTYYTKKDYDDSNVEVYEIIYYDTFRGAVTDINNDEIGANTNATKETAVSGIYINKKQEPTVVLLKDVTETRRISVSADMTINLGGNVLTIEEDYYGLIGADGNTVTIDGRLRGSAIVLYGVDGAGIAVSTKKSNFVINGGAYSLYESAESNMVGYTIGASAGGTLSMNNCSVTATGTQNASVGAVTIKGEATLEKCNISVTSEEPGTNTVALKIMGSGNANFDNCKITISGAGNSLGVGIYDEGTATINNCKIKATTTSDQNTSMGVVNVGTGTVTVTECDITADEPLHV